MSSHWLWRSEDMSLIQIIMQRDATYDTVVALGELGMMQFNDLSMHLNAFQRQYANEVRTCEELERRIRYFEEQLRKRKIKSSHLIETQSEDIDSTTLDNLETIFSEYEEELRQLNENLTQLITEKNACEEFKYVIEHAGKFVKTEEILDARDSDVDSVSVEAPGDEPLLNQESINYIEEDYRRTGGLGYVCGVVPRDKVPTFMLLLYRATRGNMVPRVIELDKPLTDPITGKEVEKNVFIIFLGAESAKLKTEKICESIGASIYEYPEGNEKKEIYNLKEKITTFESTIRTTNERLQNILSEISVNIDKWKKKIVKEKATYHIMNMFDYNIQNSVIAEGWIPKRFIKDVQICLKRAQESSQSQVESSFLILDTKEEPPTFFETNKFTACFQDIVSSYGVPNYKEVNPTVLTIITFPFLFGVMYGDIGHGLLFTIISALLVFFEKKLENFMKSNEIFSMLYDGRYVMLLMGLFSVYCGLLYNDMFGLALNLFSAGWEFRYDGRTGQLNPIGIYTHTYIFGVDPGWFHTENKLNYYNSLKMKLSIIIGVSQMLVGVSLSAMNYIYRKDWAHILFRFIPEFLILGCTFGYLAFMIILKWCINWEGSPTNPPDLIKTMTDFFLYPTRDIAEPLYPGQKYIQIILLLVAGISVLVLLIPLPFYQLYKHKQKQKEIEESKVKHIGSMDIEMEDIDDEERIERPIQPFIGQTEEEFNFQEVLIKQLIHTIEYALGTVSHTASYLRLWALSLAHAQLSDVLFELTLGLALTAKFGNPILDALVFKSGLAVFVAFVAWISLTLIVLLGMESLGAFLHALRLHWVEFQDKFYTGEGHAFTPFSYQQIYKETTVDINSTD